MNIQQTSGGIAPFIARLVGGGVLTFFSVMHFMKPEHFRNILLAASFPMVDANVYAASAAEFVGGLLLLSGFLARIGGFFGVATMLPAIYATIKIHSLTPESLPAGLDKIPFVPPLPLPIVVTVASVVVIIFGGGLFSVDRRLVAKS